MKPFYEILVVGGGHAGTEAAYISSKMGIRTLLITNSVSKIGELSCNPAIGGLGKGHLVREVDALGGVMGVVADASGIQFRLLNKSKGPAVQGPRTQIDRQEYKKIIQKRLNKIGLLTIIEAEVIDLVVKDYSVSGVILGNSEIIYCKSVILTTGTFLNGKIHIGDKSYSGGRSEDLASIRLANRLREMNLPMGRLKTGTPPRLDSKTINWSILEKQYADVKPHYFSFSTKKTRLKQIACHITYTNKKTHEIIEKNINKSSIYNGKILSAGPRYCPSIEDKVIRFSEKESHQIFLEPEGLNSDVIYPNGISTSLPEDIQEKYVRSIKALETVKILKLGYAIEYDYVDPRSLKPSLEMKALKGLFLAGQINGTTGYEEAASQGLIAGINSVMFVRSNEPVIIQRDQGYIGVLIDDLVTRGVKEPYRMFTSRAEYRLTLRADNADQRLTQLGSDLGTIDSNRNNTFLNKISKIKKAKSVLKECKITPSKAIKLGLTVKQDGKIRSALDFISNSKVPLKKIQTLWPELKCIEKSILLQVAHDVRYDIYIRRQKLEIEETKKNSRTKIPENFDYKLINGLSNEIRAKLELIRPIDLLQASRIDGMTPAALTLVHLWIKKYSGVNRDNGNYEQHLYGAKSSF